MFSPYARKLLNRSIPNRARHRIAKPRGGRRPGGNPRPLTPQASPSPLSQSFPAPSWGLTNPASTSGSQQPSGSFTFGQQPGNPTNDQMNSQSSSFPPFGAPNFGTSAQSSAPTSTGFNFTAGAVPNNPFASLNQQPNPSANPGSYSGNLFNIPSTNPFSSQDTSQKPASEREATDSQATRSQSLFTPQASFKWGQSDALGQDQGQRAFSEPSTTAANQQSPQVSNGIFGQKGQANQNVGSIFQSFQPSPSASSNPFTQQPTQQSQTSNIFGSKSETSFPPRTDQPVANMFSQSLGQSQSSNPTSAKPATSPTENGDAMSTTPDTSPQSSNDRGRYGSLAPAGSAPKPALINGDIRNGPSNLFDFSSSLSSTKATETMANREISEKLFAGNEGSGDVPSGISLGSPKKGQGSSFADENHDQPSMQRQRADETAVERKPFGILDFSAPQGASPTPPPAFNLFPNAFGKQSSDGPEESGAPLSSTFGQSISQHVEAPKISAQRRPGIPPTPPEDFSEEQKRQLITGYRLKALDSGLRSYLEYCSYHKDEIESVSTFYELRRKAILEANGGPVEELDKKRPAEADLHRFDLQSKRARRQLSASDIQEPSQSASSASMSHNSSKRKANEGLSREEDQSSRPSASKKSKPEDPITYPSLPPSFPGSQTAKVFGNLVGKKIHAESEDLKQPTANGGSSNSIASTNAPMVPQTQNSSRSSNAGNTVLNNATQNPLFGSSIGPSSTPSQPASENPRFPNQSQEPQASTAFKGFVPSQSMSSSNHTPVSSSVFAIPPNFNARQPLHSPSVLRGSNDSASDRPNSKRKADDNNEDPGVEDEPSSDANNDPRTKKQRIDEAFRSTSDTHKAASSIFKSQVGTGQTDSAESIFSHGGKLANSSSNIFSHLGGSNYDQDDDEADNEDDGVDERSQRSAPAKKTNLSTESSELSKNNPFASSFHNPLAGSKSKTPTKIGGAEKPEGRSLFDRIERDENGQAFRSSEPVNFGDNVLKTPATKDTDSSSHQQRVGTSNSVFGATSATSSAPGGSIFGIASFNSADKPSSPTSGSNIFGFPSNSSLVPNAHPSESPVEDHTWKPGTPLKFGGAPDAPSISLSSPSPGKSPLTGLFGAPKASMTSTTPAPFSFTPVDFTSPKSASLTFGISAPIKDSSESLAPPSGTQSESTSRATSPGATAGESGNEASDEVHEEERHPELDNTEASKAEADEDTIFDSKVKLLKLTESKQRNIVTETDEITRKWTLQGNEQFRVLKNRDTKKTRMIMKLKVNGRVILNAGLEKSLSYVLAAPKNVRVPVPTKDKVETWLVQLEKEDDGPRLVSMLEDNKGN
ncbi:MAG: hypothetical protein Q9220_002541 [cf. Caloplaca sp. 1 TL-2023]